MNIFYLLIGLCVMKSGLPAFRQVLQLLTGVSTVLTALICSWLTVHLLFLYWEMRLSDLALCHVT